MTAIWGKTGGKFNFFWISWTGENVPSLHLAGEMAGRSASCGRGTAGIGPACPGEEIFGDTEKTISSQPANWEAQLELCEGWRDSACQGLRPHPGGSFNSMLTLEQMDI